jgi:replication factor C subunit 3/5
MNLPQQWVDVYKPLKLDDIISHSHVIKILKNMIDNNCLTHLLFNGERGTGKSSTINSIINEMYGSDQNIMTLKLNASNHRGIEVVRNEIKTFVTTRMITSKYPKLVILDEADAMTMDAQLALRRIMDKYSNNAKFCIICNYLRKIHPALISRCSIFRFKTLDHISMKMRLNYIIDQEKINLSNNVLDKIIEISNHDMRHAIYMLQTISNHKNKTISELCNIFHYPSEDEECIFLNLIKMPIKERIETFLKLLDIFGYHLSTIINIYFKYLYKKKDYDKIIKLSMIENQIQIEYSLKIQSYALMSIL